jgi:hypothetical protein
VTSGSSTLLLKLYTVSYTMSYVNMAVNGAVDHLDHVRWILPQPVLVRVSDECAVSHS